MGFVDDELAAYGLLAFVLEWMVKVLVVLAVQLLGFGCKQMVKFFVEVVV